jgi:hypothetical protein
MQSDWEALGSSGAKVKEAMSVEANHGHLRMPIVERARSALPPSHLSPSPPRSQFDYGGGATILFFHYASGLLIIGWAARPPSQRLKTKASAL